MNARPARQPAAKPDLPKAPTAGHPARRLPDPTESSGATRELAAAAASSPTPVPAADASPLTQPEPTPPSAGAETEEQRVNFGARVRQSVRRRARVWAVQNDRELQDLLDEALDEYLRARGA